MTTEGMRLRMAFAKQAKQIKEDGAYGTLPDAERLQSIFAGEMLMYEALICLQEKERTIADLSRELGQTEEQVSSLVEMLRKKKLWEGELCEA